MAVKVFKNISGAIDASSELAKGDNISIQTGRLSLIGSTVNALGAGPGQDGTIQYNFEKKLRVEESLMTPDATIFLGWQVP